MAGDYTVLRTDDLGLHWRSWCFSAHSWTVEGAYFVEEASPLNDSILYGFGSGIQFSEDAGFTWRFQGDFSEFWRGSYDTDATHCFSSIHEREFLFLRYGAEIESLRLARTTDLGQTWTYTQGYVSPSSIGMVMTQYTADPETLLAIGGPFMTRPGGFWYSTDSARTWTLVPGFDWWQSGFWPYGMKRDPRTGYIYGLRYPYGVVYNDLTSISHWQLFGDTLDAYAVNMLFDPDTAGIIYAVVGITERGIYRSDGTGPWELFCPADDHAYGHDCVVLSGWPKTVVSCVGYPRGSDTGIYFYTHTRAPDGVGKWWQPLPEALSIRAFPNPFNPTTTLVFSLPRSSPIKITIYNLLGQQVYAADLGRLPAGEHRHVFNASDLPSGVYFVGLSAAGMTKTRKLVVLR